MFEDSPQPVRERADLPGPGEGGVGLAVDLGQHAVEDEVMELLLAAYVAVQRTGNHSEAGGEGAHAEGPDTTGADDYEGLGDDSFAGEGAAAVLVAVWGGEPEQACARVAACCLRLICHACLRVPGLPR